jgi:hypothetical protein
VFDALPLTPNRPSADALANDVHLRILRNLRFSAICANPGNLRHLR